MEAIANDSPRGRRIKKDESRADRARARGVCPHDSQACRHSRRCTLGRSDACANLLNCNEYRCTRCRALHGACAFRCFRRDGYAKKGGT